MAEKQEVGTINHFFPKISVAIVELSAALHVGDDIEIEGKEMGFKQKVESMQIEHVNVQEAKKGDAIGLKVAQPVREGAKVFKV